MSVAPTSIEPRFRVPLGETLSKGWGLFTKCACYLSWGVFVMSLLAPLTLGFTVPNMAYGIGEYLREAHSGDTAGKSLFTGLRRGEGSIANTKQAIHGFVYMVFLTWFGFLWYPLGGFFAIAVHSEVFWYMCEDFAEKRPRDIMQQYSDSRDVLMAQIRYAPVVNLEVVLGLIVFAFSLLPGGVYLGVSYYLCCKFVLHETLREQGLEPCEQPQI